jgi:hypothetical protein
MRERAELQIALACRFVELKDWNGTEEREQSMKVSVCCDLVRAL